MLVKEKSWALDIEDLLTRRGLSPHGMLHRKRQVEGAGAVDRIRQGGAVSTHGGEEGCQARAQAVAPCGRFLEAGVQPPRRGVVEGVSQEVEPHLAFGIDQGQRPLTRLRDARGPKTGLEAILKTDLG